MKHLLSAFFSFSFSISLLAALPTRPFTQPSNTPRTIALTNVLSEAKLITPAAFPDADIVLIDSVAHESYEPNGTSVLFDDTYLKILTEKGRRSESTSSFHFNVVYSTNEIVAAEIIKPNGSITPIDLSRNASIMVDPGSMSENIYDPNDKILRISFPGLEINDIVHIALRITNYKTRIPNFWSDYQIFESTYPIRRYSYFVTSPNSLPIQTSAHRAPVLGSFTNYTSSLPNQKTLHAFHFQDVPQLFPEPDMPPIHTVAQRVLLSTASSWKELSSWYYNLCKPHLTPSPEMISTVSNILEKASVDLSSSPESRIWPIFTWVSQNIRYMGITTETEAPGYEPHDVATTFNKRYGVCRDKAALLASMLQIAKIDAYPVLIHVGEKRDPDVPMAFFNHAIVGVREPDGSFSLMDPTNENTRDLLPAYLTDKSFLPATPEGSDLLTSPLTPAAENMLFVKSKGSINADGELSLSSTIEFEGLNDGAYRGFFAEISSEDRQRFFETIAKRRIPGARLNHLSISPSDLRDTDSPLSVSLSLSAPNFLAIGDASTLIPTPFFSTSLGYVNFLINSTGLPSRRFPLEIGTPCGVEESLSLSLDSPISPLSIPENTSFSTNGISFARRTTTKDDSLSVSRRFEINLASLSPDLYPHFKASLHEIDRLNDQKNIFNPLPSKRDSNADYLVLDREICFDVVDSSSWTTTVSSVSQVLSYAGQKNHSEIQIPFNTACESVELLYASVSNRNGSVYSVSPEEINILDAPWVASAPRYPASKTLVISLPSVEVGSVIRTSFRITRTKAPFFFGRTVFQSTDPVNRSRAILRSSDNICINTKIFNKPKNFSESVTTNQGIETVVFESLSPQTLPKENSLPPAFVYAHSLYMSSGDWPSYLKTLSNIVKDAIAPSNTIACSKKAIALTKNTDDMIDKIRTIRDFVAREIRLDGPSFTDLPLQASPADVTLRDGYGNNLDRAILLLAMLTDIGLDAEMIFASSTPREYFDFSITSKGIPYFDIPDWNSFPDPLVAVLDEDEPLFFLGDTDQYAEIGTTAHRGHLAISSPDEEGNFISLITPSTDENFDKIFSHRTIDLSANGDAMITVSNLYFGLDAATLKRTYAEITPEKLRRNHLELIGSFSKAATPTSPLSIVTNEIPYSRSYSFSAPNYASRSGDTLTLTLPPPPSFIPASTDSRALPLRVYESDQTLVTYSVLLPPETDAVLMSPKDIEFNYEDITLPAYAILAGDDPLSDGRRKIFVFYCRGTSDYVTVGPEFYPTILEMNRAISNPRERTIILRLKPNSEQP